MFYKKILFLPFYLSLSISQSFFNISIPNELGFRSAKSTAIGLTHFINTNTSVNSFRNPAKLHWNDNNLNFDINLLGNLVNERRSIELLDYFGDFLTESDYVFNQNVFYNSQLGITGKLDGVGFAISHGPWSTFNYNYEEEVRGSASFDDGIIGIRDPIIGYHIFKHSGQINLTSFGFGFPLNRNLSFGIGINYLSNSYLEFDISSVKIGDSLENLAPVANSSGRLKFDGDRFISFSLIAKRPSLNYFFGFEQGIENDTLTFNLSEIAGLPIYISAGEVDPLSGSFAPIDPANASQIYEIEDTLLQLRYLPNLYLPKARKIKFGISHKEGTNYNSRMFSLEFISSQFVNNYYKDFYRINMGIEYSKFENTIRMGISYEESTLQSLSPKATFCFGNSQKFQNITLDLGITYSYQKYKYHDLFPVQGDVRPDFDTVHESQWSLVSTILYSL